MTIGESSSANLLPLGSWLVLILKALAMSDVMVVGWADGALDALSVLCREDVNDDEPDMVGTLVGTVSTGDLDP